MKVIVSEEIDGKTIPHVHGPLVAGAIVDMPDDIARSLIERGVAKKVTETATRKTTRGAATEDNS